MFSTFINPRSACAARVTVLGSVCLCVCVSVKSHLTSRMSIRAINQHAYLVAYERQKICGDLPETTAFKRYAVKYERKANMLIYRLTHGQLSPLDAQQNVRGYPGIVNDIQACPKRCLLMPLVRVGARTDSTTRAVTTQGVANFRARVLAYVQYAPRVCTSVLFIMKLIINQPVILFQLLTDCTW